MKTHGLAFLFLASLFFSCQLEDSIDQTGNYWESNYLRKHLLRGAVHTLTSVDTNGSTHEVFNREGNPISGYTIMNRSMFSDTSTWSMAYAGGRLVSSTVFPSKRQPLLHTTTQYDYGNTGKYIPDPDELVNGHLSLIPGLSAQYSDSYRYDFTFYGSELWVVHSAQGMDNDTTIVQFTGNYPSSFKNRYFECTRIEYAENGMIKSYKVLSTEGYVERVYTYLPNKSFQLMDNQVTTALPWDQQTNMIYNYNDHQDVLEIVSDGGYNARYSNYAYDSKGNWTRRSFSYTTNGTESLWSENVTDLRTIIYY
jgi:hypothetical protein